MKKKIVLMCLITLGSYHTLFACDICGCSVFSGPFNGILPQFTKNLVGIRTSTQKFTHPNTELNYNGNSRVLEDRYYTSELWFRYYPTKKLQTFLFIPFKYNQRIETEKNNSLYGIGDIYASALYPLFKSSDSSKSLTNYNWLLGGGIKLPTGKYQQRDANKTMLPVGFQTGNGAYSFLASSNFTVRKAALGLNTQINYTVNGTNELDYKFGNAFSGIVTAFYWKKMNRISLLPSIGILYEKSDKDIQYKIEKMNTGNDALSTNIGIEMYAGQWLISAYYQKSLYQKLYASQPESAYKFQCGIGHYF